MGRRVIVPVEHRGVPARIPALPSAGAWLAERSDGHRLHAGVDLGGAPGTPVLAPESGRVVRVVRASRPSEPRASTPAGWAGYGPMALVLQGDSGAYHLLAHLGSVEVARGATVSEAEQLGTIGELAHGSHCHWEVRAREQPSGGAAVVEVAADPGAWLDGNWSPWSGECPLVPDTTRDTPRACRPGRAGPAPRPFPRRRRGASRTCGIVSTEARGRGAREGVSDGSS